MVMDLVVVEVVGRVKETICYKNKTKNKMKKILLGFILLTVFTQSKAQYIYTEISAGYSHKPANAMAFIMKVGIINDDVNVNGARGVYLTMPRSLTRAKDVAQPFGIHYMYNLSGFSIDAGIDYHVFYNQGIRFGCGVTKYFQNVPWIISVNLSDKMVFTTIGWRSNF
jgi:hypothetical protein